MYILISALLGKPDDFSGVFTGVEDISAREVFLPLPEGFQDLVKYVGFSRIMSDCTVSPVKAFHSYSGLIEFE